MVYKKYIKKDGKLYGPYIYQSKRVDGKVVSEYCGPGKKDNKKLIFSLMAFLVFGILILLFFLIKGNLTGNVTLNVNNSKDVEGVSQNSLEQISISLKQGEFIPGYSKLLFETSSGNYEYPLKDLIDEHTIRGKYFVEGENLIGEGEGYGFIGKIITSPQVEFILISRTIVEEENSSEQSSEEEVIIQEENNKEGIIPQVIESVNNFFLSLSLTGNVVESSSQIQEISGKSSKNNPFVYTLKENEIVELVPGSAKINNQILQDSVLSTSVIGGNFVVETNYEKIEEGYGQEFLGNEKTVLTVPVPLEVVQSGNYNVKLIYDLGESQEELDVELDIIEPNKENSEIIEQENTLSQNETILPSDENFSIILNSSISELTSKEKETLISEFGNFSVKAVKSQLFNGRYVISYELGNYNIEYSYDSSLSQEILNFQIKNDRIKWLRDISTKLTSKNNLPTKVNQFDSEFSIF